MTTNLGETTDLGLVPLDKVAELNSLGEPKGIRVRPDESVAAVLDPGEQEVLLVVTEHNFTVVKPDGESIDHLSEPQVLTLLQDV
ncbi:hypothetical protein [Antrihabitans sp. YC2-6]|uniref:hypothetical protein n=1 Tax=Antrihabitans sp. YC2-6 TaxID=2799498 RepID=UPI0018F306EB|nr:hypothetical protein [Antrihabitans sp. YC2-6]MBJ8345708.1 hypothetical protein [Antrihabitans sp. YC2-6]